MMKRRNFLEVLGAGLGSLLLPAYGKSRPTPTPRAALDMYGGIIARPSPNPATGYFRIEKDSTGRWLFVSPLGNYMWLLAVYTMTDQYYTTPAQWPPNSIVPPPAVSVTNTKYPGTGTVPVSHWAQNCARRTKSWGFNVIGDYWKTYVLPIDTNNFHGNANPNKMPFIALINGMVTMFGTGYNTVAGLQEQPKNIISGVPTTVTSVYRNGHTVDIFDSNVTTGYANVVKRQQATTYTGGWNTAPGGAGTPWILGVTPDDPDYLYGLKNQGTAGFPSPHAHIGYMVAVAAPDYNAAHIPVTTPGKTTWANPLLASKQRWIQNMQTKYNNIIALNNQWGSTYSSFGSAGGYGVGTGLLDEAGLNPWFGDIHGATTGSALTGIPQNVATDLDAMLLDYARQYCIVTYTPIRAINSNYLIFGPPALGAQGYPARPQVLQAMMENGINAFVHAVGPNTNLSGAIDSYNRTGVPAFIWYAVTANLDSALYPTPSNATGVPDFPTQEYRSDWYTHDIQAMLNSTGANGDHNIAGMNFWSWSDGHVVTEAVNYGLVTDRDNAYDGVEATTTSVVDAAGYTTIPEEGNYGNFLTNVTATNISVTDQIASGTILPVPLGPAQLSMTSGIGPGSAARRRR